MQENLDNETSLQGTNFVSLLALRYFEVGTGNHVNTYSAKNERQNYDQYCIWLLPSLEIKTRTCYLSNFLLFEFFKSFLLSQSIDIMGLRQGKIQMRPAQKTSDGIKI